MLYIRILCYLCRSIVLHIFMWYKFALCVRMYGSTMTAIVHTDQHTMKGATRTPSKRTCNSTLTPASCNKLFRLILKLIPSRQIVIDVVDVNATFAVGRLQRASGDSICELLLFFFFFNRLFCAMWSSHTSNHKSFVSPPVIYVIRNSKSRVFNIFTYYTGW